MPENDSQILSGVAETLLTPLYWKAVESQCPDAIMPAVAETDHESTTF